MKKAQEDLRHIVKKEFDRFLESRSKEETEERIASHLAKCKKCNKEYGAKYEQYMSCVVVTEKGCETKSSTLNINKILDEYQGPI